jgi:carboxyl-terminal processing protease
MQPHGWQLGPAIGYLELPDVSGNQAITKAYAQAAQRCIRDMDQAGTSQWVLDLRRNTGGNMWPMLVGVQSLLGMGACGFFVSPMGKQTSWLPNLAAQTNALLDECYCLNQPSGAIAVLTSRLTCSAGEFITLAFRGRPQTRSFGEPTAGLPTANSGKTLSDGAQLLLTVAYGADRTGRIYAGPIIPDQPVASDWTLFQAERDPVMLAAVEWLRSRGTA